MENSSLDPRDVREAFAQRRFPAPIVLALIVLLPVSAQAQFPAFPPDSVTSTLDRDQMLWQLGIKFPKLPPKLEDQRAPRYAHPSKQSNPEGNWSDSAGHFYARSGFGLWNNYDDVRVGLFPGPDSERTGIYTPIDLLKMDDGAPTRTPDQWWTRRRPELLNDVQEHLWGVIPPDSVLPKVTWSVTTTSGMRSGLEYKQKSITGTIDVSRYPSVRNKPKISATLRIPSGVSGKLPVMIVIGNVFWTPIDVYWDRCSPHGWGVCIFDAAALQPDDGAYLTSYLIGLCNKGNWRKPDDWGTLGAWSWGVDRLIDYFGTDPDVDATKIGATGHSRFGKAAVVAMAFDRRLAIAFPSCAGSLGTKMNRRHWGQDLEDSGWDREYHWVAGNFFKWMGPLHDGEYLPRKIERCPVDAHSLLALCAPRPVFLNGGMEDWWTDPYGMYLTGKKASPVYEFLGATGLIMPDTKPIFDVPYVAGDIAYRFHKGGHTDAPDWPSFFEFAAKYMKPPVLMKPTTIQK